MSRETFTTYGRLVHKALFQKRVHISQNYNLPCATLEIYHKLEGLHMFLVRFIHKHFLLGMSSKIFLISMSWALFIIGFYIGWIKILQYLNGEF